jgi:hypothetical protein
MAGKWKVVSLQRKPLKDKYKILHTSRLGVKPYLRDMVMGEYLLEEEQKYNICTNFLLCRFKGCPHIKKHPTNYYYDGKKWSTCREISCGQRYTIQGEVGCEDDKAEQHSCIEVKE